MVSRFWSLLLLVTSFASLRSQTTLPNLPPVILDTINNTTGYITGFELDSVTKKLYIAGEFTRVGNVNRQGFAVIDINTGAVLNDLSFISLYDLSFTNHVKAKLKLFKDRIYIGGSFYTPDNYYLFSINLNTYDTNYIYDAAPISDFEIYNNKIYTAGAVNVNDPAEFNVNEMDTLGIITWQKPILSVTNEHFSCLAIRNNTLFVGGVFSSFGGVSVNNIAKVDLGTKVISTWQLSPLPGPSGNLNCFDVLDIAVLPNDVLLNITTSSCATPPNNVAAYNLATGNINTLIPPIAFNFGHETILSDMDTSYWYSNAGGMKLRSLNGTVDPWAPVSNNYIDPFFKKAGYLFVGGNFSLLQGASYKGLGGFCLAPRKPEMQSLFTKACHGQSNVSYSIKPIPNASSYFWQYTGTGVTINGSGSTVSLNFSSTATSGTFKIYAKSYCGAPSDTLFVPFTVYPLPNVNAGPNVRFTCSNNIDSLKGSSTTPGVTFTWVGPSYISGSAINQVNNTFLPGNYMLWVTDPISGCQNPDTALIWFDTLAPAIDHNLLYGQLNCISTVVVMDAAPLYSVNDNLHWSGNSFSQNNPANVTVAGIYTLTITSGTNDCISKDTFSVSANTTPPTISAPLVLDTIICSRDSVQLPASSGSLNAVLYWNNSNMDSLANNSYTHLSGTYVAHALDTANGCANQLIRVVNQYTTPPVVQVPSGNFNVNCSFSNVTLNGSTPNIGATLNWGGPNNFSSNNPATATQPGHYVLSATNPQNGCKARDSVEITLQNILMLTSSNDTIICNGSSATLSASPIGGTPGFSYSWSNTAGTSNPVTVSPTDTTAYIVTITDNTGCVGIDTILVIVPALLGDSVHTFQPCDPNNPNGQIQAYGTGGTPPYQFALNGGSFQSSGIFPGLNFGTYSVSVKDSLGCLFGFSATIDQSSTLPTPDFILATTEIQGDTFVLVDISNPRPDSVKWVLPAGCTIINSDPFSPQIVHTDTGSMQITLVAWFGICQMQLTKNILVVEPDTNLANSSNNNGIANLVLYPNPNTGQFTVDISFYKKQSFAIFIFDALGNELLRVPYSETDFASAAISLNNVAPGTYLLKVIAEYDSRNRAFLINQH